MWSYHYKNGSGTWSNIICWSPHSFRGGVDRDTDCLDMWGSSKTRILPPFLCKLANKSQFYGSIPQLVYTTLANKSYFLLLLLQLLVSCLIIIARNSLQSFLEMENVFGRHLECQPLDLTLVLFSTYSNFFWICMSLGLFTTLHSTLG